MPLPSCAHITRRAARRNAARAARTHGRVRAPSAIRATREGDIRARGCQGLRRQPACSGWRTARWARGKRGADTPKDAWAPVVGRAAEDSQQPRGADPGRPTNSKPYCRRVGGLGVSLI
eukprot:scaffold9618_cov123-Isochrysis_galbana.AAC.8